ncbi:MAG TPA: M28 family peptidase [Planctomycetota bacterium]|nr:M28 family peptidase [Planctomycetota bacterium]
MGFALSLLQSASLPASSPRLARTVEAHLAARVDDASCVASAKELVTRFRVRAGGSPDGDAAAEWMAARFREAGLEVEIVDDPLRDAWWADPWTLVVHAGGRDEKLEAAWPWFGSPSLDGTFDVTADPARAEGRALVAAQPAGGRPALWLVDGRAAASGHPVPGQAPRGGAPVFGVSRAEGARLREPASAGARVEVALSTHRRRAPVRTVVATLPGRDRSRHVLLCAHGDSDGGGPGADDNASGEAVVLAVARALGAAVAAGEIAPPACDFRFAIWGAEIHSSRAYVERQRTSRGGLGAIAAVVNVDQAGYGVLFDAVYVEPDDRAVNRPLAAAILGALADFHGEPGFPDRFTSNAALGGTDSYVFDGSMGTGSASIPSLSVFVSAFGSSSKTRRGDPSLPHRWPEVGDAVTVDFSDVYHSSGDTLERTFSREPFNPGRVARAAMLGLLRFAGE